MTDMYLVHEDAAVQQYLQLHMTNMESIRNKAKPQWKTSIFFSDGCKAHFKNATMFLFEHVVRDSICNGCGVLLLLFAPVMYETLSLPPFQPALRLPHDLECGSFAENGVVTPAEKIFFSALHLICLTLRSL